MVRWSSSQISQIELADLAQAFHVHLGVDAGRLRAAMAQVISDLLERESFGKHPGCTGVPERVRARCAACYTQRAQAPVDEAVVPDGESGVGVPARR